jgi:hypothetical protein
MNFTRKDEKQVETAHTYARFPLPFSGLFGNAGMRYQHFMEE